MIEFCQIRQPYEEQRRPSLQPPSSPNGHINGAAGFAPIHSYGSLDAYPWYFMKELPPFS